jgi:hypothetical protein
MVPPEIRCTANLGLVGPSPESDGHGRDSATVAPKLFYSKVQATGYKELVVKLQYNQQSP